MNRADFDASLRLGVAPENMSLVLQSLWALQHGDWNGAHAIIQDDESPEVAWMHAHLHRVEGDAANAAYWYRKAGRPVCVASLADECEALRAAWLER